MTKYIPPISRQFNSFTIGKEFNAQPLFDAPLQGRSFHSYEYRFAFNGMEKIDEIIGSENNLDFGARIYDARLGKWFSADPLQEKYSSFSPYCFATNKPILFMDFDGRDIILSTQFYNSRYKNSLIKLLNANTSFTNTYIAPFTLHGKDVRLDYFSFSLNGQTTNAPCKNNGKSNENYTDSRFAETSDNTRKITGKEAIFFNSDAVFRNDFDPTSGAPIHSSGEQGGVLKGNFITENFMLVTVMHEFMHANWVTHEEMASQSNITLVANTLLKIDPNLSSEQANALAWTGLEDTDAWRAKSDTERKGILEQIGTLKRGKQDTTIPENKQREGLVPDQKTKTAITKKK